MASGVLPEDADWGCRSKSRFSRGSRVRRRRGTRTGAFWTFKAYLLPADLPLVDNEWSRVDKRSASSLPSPLLAFANPITTRLDERWGAETSAKGTRFKLNRDMAGYHLTNRAEVTIEGAEAAIKIKLADPPKLRTLGDLIHFDNVTFKFPKATVPLLEEVTFTVEQGGRCAFVGAVRLSLPPSRDFADPSCAERTRQVDARQAHPRHSRPDQGQNHSTPPPHHRLLLPAFRRGTHRRSRLGRTCFQTSTDGAIVLSEPFRGEGRDGGGAGGEGVPGVFRSSREGGERYAVDAAEWRAEGSFAPSLPGTSAELTFSQVRLAFALIVFRPPSLLCVLLLSFFALLLKSLQTSRRANNARRRSYDPSPRQSPQVLQRRRHRHHSRPMVQPRYHRGTAPARCGGGW